MKNKTEVKANTTKASSSPLTRDDRFLQHLAQHGCVEENVGITGPRLPKRRQQDDRCGFLAVRRKADYSRLIGHGHELYQSTGIEIQHR